MAIQQRGFSLIELAVVVLVLAIAAGAVALRMHGPMRRATLTEVVGQVTHFDLLARVYASRHDRSIRLAVDIGAGRIRRVDRRSGQENCPPLQLPSGYRIARLIVRDQDMTSGSVSIPCSALGLTPSYAILVQGPGNHCRWVLTAGFSGQHVELGTEDDVQNILAATGQRTDAR